MDPLAANSFNPCYDGLGFLMTIDPKDFNLKLCFNPCYDGLGFSD